MGGCQGVNNKIDPHFSAKHINLAKECIDRAKRALVVNKIAEAISNYSTGIMFLKDAGIEDHVVRNLLIKSYLEQGDIYSTLNDFCQAINCYHEAKNLGCEQARSKIIQLQEKRQTAIRNPSVVPTIIVGDTDQDCGTNTQRSKCSLPTNRTKSIYSPLVSSRLTKVWAPNTLILSPIDDDPALVNSPRAPRITSPRITSPRITSPRITSPSNKTSPRKTSPRDFGSSDPLPRNSTLIEHAFLRENTNQTPRDIRDTPIESNDIKKQRSASLSSSASNNSENIPIGFPKPPGGLEHLWEFNASLHYSLKWIDKGIYNLYPLDFNQEDFRFIESLYEIHAKFNTDVMAASIIYDIRKEQTFIAGLDLLEKKHGNMVHKPKWKMGKCPIRLLSQQDNNFTEVQLGTEIVIYKSPYDLFKIVYKNKYGNKIEFLDIQNLMNLKQEILNKIETLDFNGSILSKDNYNQQDVEQIYHFVYQQVKSRQGQTNICNFSTQTVNNQLKSKKYRSPDVPHVKLLPLWYGVTNKQIIELKETGFEYLTYKSSLLGKGYYGNTNPIAAYTIAKQEYPQEQIVLLLSWYAGKVVYPVSYGDQPEEDWIIRLYNSTQTIDLEKIKIGKEIVIIKEDLDNDLFNLKLIYSLIIDHELIVSHTMDLGLKDFPEQLSSPELEFDGGILPKTLDNEKIYNYIYKEVNYKKGYIQPKLITEPHYANYDMHFAPLNNINKVAENIDQNTQYQVVVFDASQVLPRYLVMLKTEFELRSLSSSCCEEQPDHMTQLIDRIPYSDPGESALIFKPDFSYSVALLYNTSIARIKRQISLVNNDELIEDNLESFQDSQVIRLEQDSCLIKETLNNFYLNDNQEVLLLTVGSNQERLIIASYIELIFWNNLTNDQPIPLYIDLLKINQENLTENLIEDYLLKTGLAIDLILELKEHKEWLFILDHYEDLKHKPRLLKSNHFNKPNSFSGKIIVLLQKDWLNPDDYWCFYTKEHRIAQQVDCIVHRHIAILPQKYQQKICAILEQPPIIRLPKDNYQIACKNFSQNSPTSKLLPTPGGELKLWQFDGELQNSKSWINKGTYKILSLTKEDADYDFVTKLYQQTPMPDYEIDQIYLIADQAAEQAFNANLVLLSHHASSCEYQPSWHKENNVPLRIKVNKMLEDQCYSSALVPGVKLIPLWHGTGPNQASGIATTGFASLALVDAGYFGKGIYGSTNAEYAYRVYAMGYNKDNEVLLLSWCATQNVYPVIDGDLSILKGHANYQNYDSHFIPVRPENQSKHLLGQEDTYLPINDQQDPVYYELVTFQTVQSLPRYFLSLKKIGGLVSSNGLSKIVSAPYVHEGNRVNLYKKDLEWAIAFLKYEFQTEITEDVILYKGLSLYVPASGTDDNIDQSEQQYLLGEKASLFLKDPAKEVWILIGNSGAGKTLFVKHLEKTIWDTYPKQTLIPLFISLKQFKDLSTINDLVTKALMQKGIPPKTILELKRNKRFLFILDGYDSSLNKLQLIKKYKFNEPKSWYGKIIVCCSSEDFSDSDKCSLYPHHVEKNPIENANSCQKTLLVPFSTAQITQYIYNFCESDFNKFDWDTDSYQLYIQKFNELIELLKEPFLLFLAVNALPSISEQSFFRITTTELYKTFISEWFDSQFEKMVQSNFDFSQYLNPRKTIYSIFESCATTLAYIMFLEDSYYISEREEILNTKDMCLGLKSGLFKKNRHMYSFINTSFRDFFVAQKILTELISLEESNFATCLLQKKALDHKNKILNFLADQFIIRNSSLAKRLEVTLFNLVFAARKLPELNIASTNAASILNIAGIPFSNKDCSNLTLTGVNFSYGIFDNTNFEGADLTNANFSFSWLRQANLRNARMKGVNFGEMVSLKLSKKIYLCIYSNDGKYFAVSHGNTIIIYDAKTLQELNVLTEHASLVSSIAFNKSGTLLGSAISDNTIILWDLKNFMRVNSFLGHTDFINNITFSRKGNYLISASQDHSIRIWDLRQIHFPGVNGGSKHVFNVHSKAVNMVVVAPNVDYIASASADCTVCLFDYKKLCLVHVFIAHSQAVLCVAFNPAGDYLVSGGADHTICIWDPKNFCHKHTIESHAGNVNTVMFSPNGNLLVSAGADQTIRFWDLPMLNHRGSFVVKSKMIRSVTFNHIGDRLAAVGDDNMVNFWDLSKSYCKHLLAEHSKPVKSIAFSPTGHQLISGSYDRTIGLWDLKNFYNINIFSGHEGIVTSVAFNFLGHQIASGSWDKTIRIWDPLHFNSITEDHQQQTAMWSAEVFVNSVAFSPITSNQLVFAGSDSKVVILDLEKFTEQCSCHGHTSLVSSVKYGPYGDQIATGSYDRTIRFWDFRQLANKFSFKGHSNYVNDVAFHPTGNYLASGSNDNTVRIWSLEQASCMCVLSGHTAEVNCVAFSQGGRYLASGSNDHSIRIWDLKKDIISLRDVQEKPHVNIINANFPVLSLAWFGSGTDDSLYLATGGDDSSVRLWRMEQEKMFLVWSNCQNSLCLDQANIEGTQLEHNNVLLFKQKGGINEPTDLDNQSKINSVEEPVEPISGNLSSIFGSSIKGSARGYQRYSTGSSRSEDSLNSFLKHK